MGNTTPCSVCPGSRRLSYRPISSDEETISATGAWVEKSLNKAKHAERLRIKEEVLDELLALRQMDEEIGSQTDYGSYSPPQLPTLEWDDAREVRKTCRIVDAIPDTDEQELSGGSEPPFDDELLQRRVVFSSIDHSLKDMEDLEDFSESTALAKDYITQVVEQDFEENSRMGCESLILNYDTDPTGPENTDGTPEFDTVLDKWGFDDSDDDQLFQQASPKSRRRSNLTLAELRTSRNRLLQDDEQHEEDVGTWSEQHEELGTWGLQEMKVISTSERMSPRSIVL